VINAVISGSFMVINAVISGWFMVINAVVNHHKPTTYYSF
jgi:hypothetical protein